MAEYLVSDTELTAIADGFRSSRGVTDQFTLEQMATMAAEPAGAIVELMYLNDGYITLCEKGMTWGEFIESKYNYLQTVENVQKRYDYTSDGYIYRRPYSNYYHVSVDGTANGRVKATDKIIENHVYSMYDDD